MLSRWTEVRVNTRVPTHLTRHSEPVSLRLRDGRAKQIQEKRAQKRVDANAGDRVVATNRRARYDYRSSRPSNAASCSAGPSEVT